MPQKAMGPESHRGPLNIQRGWSTANSHGSFTHRGFTMAFPRHQAPHRPWIPKMIQNPNWKMDKNIQPPTDLATFRKKLLSNSARRLNQIPTHTADSEIWTRWRLHPMGRAWWVADLTDFLGFSYWDLDDLARKTLDNLLEIEESSHFLGKQTYPHDSHDLLFLVYIIWYMHIFVHIFVHINYQERS